MSVLARLRELDANATPGPWHADPLMRSIWRARWFGAIAKASRVNELGKEDTDLIVAMRNALPLLLNIAEVAEEAAGYSRPTESVMRRLRHAVAALENQENT